MSKAQESAAAARALMARHPVFDAHVDSIGLAVDLGHDLGERGLGQLDLVRGREGGLGSVVFACWVNPRAYPEGHFERASAMLDGIHALVERHPERARLVRDGAQLAAAHAGERIAVIAGIEGGHAIEESLEKLEHFFARGVRVMTLVWNNHLSWVQSCAPGGTPGAGLSAFGRSVVRRMNRLGMLVDLSHAGRRSFFDALEASERPSMASHSGCSAVHDHPRNLDEEQLRALARNGGVIGIVFHPGFLDAGAQADEERLWQSEAYASIPKQSWTASLLERQALMGAQAQPLAAERLVDHVVHAVEVAGVEHVGIGSDYDGIEHAPRGLEDASRYGHLCELLLGRGFAAHEVEQILGRNMERVFREATVANPGSGTSGS